MYPLFPVPDPPPFDRLRSGTGRHTRLDNATLRQSAIGTAARWPELLELVWLLVVSAAVFSGALLEQSGLECSFKWNSRCF